MAKLPLNLSKALDVWKDVSAKAEQPVGLLLAGEAGLVGLAQQQFSAGGTVPATWVGPLADLTSVISGSGDVLVVLVPSEEETEVLSTFSLSAPRGGAVIVVDEGPQATYKVTSLGPGLVRISFHDSAVGWRQVFASCAAVAGDRAVALGRRYPTMRKVVAQRVIDRTAGQNALIGLAFFVPGADMPVMTLNQIKMVLSIASVYGEEINLERATELIGIVGMGFGFRAIARTLVRSVPGIGWVLRAVTGYTATMAIGAGAIRYFEKGAPASTSRVVALAGSLRR